MSGYVKSLIEPAKVWASHLRETALGPDLDVMGDPFVRAYCDEIVRRTAAQGHDVKAFLDDGIQHVRAMALWARSGFNVFELNQNLCAAMVMTDTRSIDLGTTIMPHETILFLLPTGFARGVEGRDYTRAWASNRSIVRTGGFLFQPKSMTDGEPGVEFIATDGTTNLSQRVARSDLDRDGWAAFEETRTAALVPDDVAALESLTKIIFGTLALVNAAPTTAERKETPRALRRRRGASESAVWTVGRTVTIDKRLVAAARSGIREVALRIKARHIVRGHFKQQAHGPGGQERSRIWVRPYWRGPEDGAEIMHVYKPQPPADE